MLIKLKKKIKFIEIKSILNIKHFINEKKNFNSHPFNSLIFYIS